MSYPHNISNDSISVTIKGTTHIVKRGDRNFDAVETALLKARLGDEAQWQVIPNIISQGVALENWSRGYFQLKDNFITFKGEKLPDNLNKRLLRMLEEGDDVGYLLRFHQRLQQNPSWRAVNQAYRFIANAGIPIGKDGCILAYKKVRN